MDTIRTRVFGEISVDEDKILAFPQGILGFPDLKRFTLIHDAEATNAPGIRWLQSLDEANFAIPVTNPFTVTEHYAPVISENVVKEIGECEEPLILVTVTVPSNIRRMSVNLMAPIVINPEDRLAVQTVVDGYEIKHYVYETLRARQEYRIWHVHDMTAKEAWELYKTGVTNPMDEKQKMNYAAAIHRLRQATKEGYELCKVEDVINSINALGLGTQDNAAIIQIIKEACN